MKKTTCKTIVQATALLLLFLLGTPTAQADIIQGRVLDAETREPLDGVHVEVTEEVPDFATVHWVRYTDSLGCFNYSCWGGSRITFRAKFLGYRTSVVRMTGTDTGDTIRIDDILLQPTEVLLKEVLVQASQRRFYMRGDTVVFNPGAFQMEGGDRLLDLIRKLPGVTLEEDQLLWNGKPLQIRMNGREALSEDLLLKRLPVEAVADVKAYERKSELEERTGVADGNRQQVLDVTIKPGFMDNWYGSVEAAGYTSRHYGTELDGMRLSDSAPVMLFAHVGDEPKKVLTHTMGSFGGESGGTAVRQQMGSAGYKHAWRPTFEVKGDSYVTLTAGANHTDRPQSSWQNTQTFLPGTTPTQTDTRRDSYEHHFKAPLDFSAFLNLSPKCTLYLTAHAGYERGETNRHEEQETFESLTLTPVRSTSGRLQGKNSSTFRSLSATKLFNGTIDGKLTYYTPKGSITATASAGYSDAKEHGNSVGEYHYQQTATQSTDRQNYEAPHRHLNVAAQLGLSHAFAKQTMFHAQWRTAYDHNFRNEQRLRADAVDTGNSFRRKDDLWLNELKTDANLTLRKFMLKPALALTYRHELTHYRRAALDTVARRNLLLLRPSLELTWHVRQQMSVKGNVSYDERPADLTDCIAYTDDTNPLFIYEGNPGLTTTRTLGCSLRYNFMLARGSQAFSIAVNYAKTYDPIGTVLHYNSQTGGYRAQKQNVQGGNGWGASLSYDRTLAKNLLFQNTISENWNTSYGILTMVEDKTGLCYNRQQSSHLQEKLGLIFERLRVGDGTSGMSESLTVSSFHDFNWERYAYSDAAQETENIFRYATQLSVSYHLKQWSFTLDPHFYLNRGYLAEAMNNNLFVLNAEVAYKFLKNRAEVILAARDLLNNETDYSSVITATTHTESGRSFLHHYATLTFRYKLEPRMK